MNWEKKPDTDRWHTAMTMYVADGYRIWKGKYRVRACIYTANEWHLQRVSDGRVLYSAKTAKECKEKFDWATSRGW